MNETQAIELLKAYESKYTTGLSIVLLPDPPPLIATGAWGTFVPVGAGGTLSSLDHTEFEDDGTPHFYPAKPFPGHKLEVGMDVVFGSCIMGRPTANRKAKISAIADYLLTFSTPIVAEGPDGFTIQKDEPPVATKRARQREMKCYPW